MPFRATRTVQDDEPRVIRGIIYGLILSAGLVALVIGLVIWLR